MSFSAAAKPNAWPCLSMWNGSWRSSRGRNQCRTLAEHQMALAQYDFREPPLLTDDEIASILTQVDALVNWASGIKEYALQAALAGTRFPGWKVVEGRANRRYVNEEAVAEKVIADGKNPYEQKLLGITAMEKLLGKKHFAELDRKSTRLNSSHPTTSRMPSSA